MSNFNPFAQEANRINQERSVNEDGTEAFTVSGSSGPGFPTSARGNHDYAQRQARPSSSLFSQMDRDKLNARANLLWGSTPRPTSHRQGEDSRHTPRGGYTGGAADATTVSSCAPAGPGNPPPISTRPPTISSIEEDGRSALSGTVTSVPTEDSFPNQDRATFEYSETSSVRTAGGTHTIADLSQLEPTSLWDVIQTILHLRDLYHRHLTCRQKILESMWRKDTTGTSVRQERHILPEQQSLRIQQGCTDKETTLGEPSSTHVPH